MAQLNIAHQNLDSATAGVVSAMGQLQVQLDELSPGPVTTQSQPAAYGLLGSILYSNRRSSVVIDGVILHEGETIHGVKVFKIHEDAVELEKNGQTWQQNVGMTFPPATDPV
jgi:type II secretory pathway component PulC